jgi:hypothetical protein
MGNKTEDLDARRLDSMRVLTEDLADEAACIREGFFLLAETRDRLWEALNSARGETARFLACTGDAFSRCERLCSSRYWLVLAGMDEEARGLHRTFLEGVEALHWLAAHPARIAEVQFGCDPRAGLRAKSVGSPYMQARRLLSEEVVHFRLRASWAKPEEDQATRSARLRDSLIGLFCSQSSLLVPGASCLAAAGEPNHDLADRVEEAIGRGFERLKVLAIPSFGVPEEGTEHERFNRMYQAQWPQIARYP